MNILLGILFGLVLIAVGYGGGKKIFRSKSKREKESSILLLVVCMPIITVVFLDLLEIVSPEVFLGVIGIALAVTIGYFCVKEGVKKVLKELVGERKLVFRSIATLSIVMAALVGIVMLPVPNWAKIIFWVAVLIGTVEFFKVLLLSEGRAASLEKMKKKYGNVNGEILFSLFWMVGIPVAIVYFLSVPFVDAVKRVRKM